MWIVVYTLDWDTLCRLVSCYVYMIAIADLGICDIVSTLASLDAKVGAQVLERFRVGILQI